MKTCPICNANSFDDMEICFACMHRFGEEPYLGIEVDDAGQIEVEEPKGDSGSALPLGKVPAAPLQKEHSDSLPAMTVPVAGRGFNLVISIQPAEELSLA